MDTVTFVSYDRGLNVSQLRENNKEVPVCSIKMIYLIKINMCMVTQIYLTEG